MRRIYAVGEDEVTKAIIRKVLSVFAPDLELFEELPARGSQVKNLINNFNKLAASDPVILLTDLDEVDCAPMAKYRLLNGQEQQEDFIINIAVDEAEAWLVADSANFADYFGIDLQDMPGFVMQRQGGKQGVHGDFLANQDIVLFDPYLDSQIRQTRIARTDSVTWQEEQRERIQYCDCPFCGAQLGYSQRYGEL